jgi:hypothetical protein
LIAEVYPCLHDATSGRIPELERNVQASSSGIPTLPGRIIKTFQDMNIILSPTHREAVPCPQDEMLRRLICAGDGGDANHTSVSTIQMTFHLQERTSPSIPQLPFSRSPR